MQLYFFSSNSSANLKKVFIPFNSVQILETPNINVKNPTAGLMTYDPVRQRLAVFNGKVWTYWKATD